MAIINLIRSFSNDTIEVMTSEDGVTLWLCDQLGSIICQFTFESLEDVEFLITQLQEAIEDVS